MILLIHQRRKIKTAPPGDVGARLSGERAALRVRDAGDNEAMRARLGGSARRGRDKASPPRQA
jgi:hypothetical protein